MKRLSSYSLMARLQRAIKKIRKNTVTLRQDKDGKKIKLETSSKKITSRFGQGVFAGAILWNPAAERYGYAMTAGFKVAGYDTDTGMLYFCSVKTGTPVCVSTFQHSFRNRADIIKAGLERYQYSRMTFLADAGQEVTINRNPKDFYARFGFNLLARLHVDSVTSVHAVGFIDDSRHKFLHGRLVYQEDLAMPATSTLTNMASIKSRADFEKSGIKIQTEPDAAWLKTE